MAGQLSAVDWWLSAGNTLNVSALFLPSEKMMPSEKTKQSFLPVETLRQSFSTTALTYKKITISWGESHNSITTGSCEKAT